MRHISQEIFTDEVIGMLPPEHQLLWIGMLTCLADDQGRMVDAPALIVGSIFPYNSAMRDDIVDAGLQWLHTKKKIIRYVAGSNGSGRRLIQIRRWWKYQASALWAARSKFPSPNGWTDRIRQHEGHPIIEINWDKVGGLRADDGHRKRWTVKPAPIQALHRTNAGPKKAQEDINDEVEDDINNEEESLPPFPPSSQDDPKAAGGHGTGSRNAPSMRELNAQQRKSAERIQKIFAVASFRDKRRAVLISALVATRIVAGDPITSRVIPAFATAHADGKVKDPTAVAVSRLENDQHNAAFEDPKTWRSVPVEVLRAAGITDLAAYKIEQFKRGGA